VSTFNPLFNMQSKFLDRLFRRVPELVWDITTGKLGVQGPDGIYTFESTETLIGEGDNVEVSTEFSVSVNPLDGFGLPIPAFASPVKHEDIQVSDLIVGAKGILGWVKEKKANSLVLLDINGMTKQYTPPKVAIFGQDGSLVVKSLGGLLGDGAQGFQSSLLPLMMLGNGGAGLDFEKLIPIMLMTQQGSGSAGLAGMLPMLLLMGNNGGSALNSLFGGSQDRAPAAQQVGFGQPPALRQTR
jgi:hypothetical protein